MSNKLAILKDLVEEFLPDNKTHQFRFQIKSESSDRLYIVAQTKLSEQWQCSCPGWIRYRNCKHLKNLLPLLSQISSSTEKKRIGK